MSNTYTELYNTNPADLPLDGTEILAVSQGGESKGVTTQAFADLASGITLDPTSPESVALIWAGSQAEYDLLTPAATTIYFITT